MSTDEASAPFRLSNISGDCSKEGREGGREREEGGEREQGGGRVGRERERERWVGIQIHAYLFEYLLWSMHVEMSLFGVEIESVPLGGEPSLLAASVHAYHISIILCDQKYVHV